MAAKILICDGFDEEGIKRLSEAGFEVAYMPKITHEELLTRIEGFDVVVVRSRTKIMKDVIEKGKNLKIIGRAGVGLDNIDVKAAEASGIKVFNTPEALTNAAAELTIGLMVALARRITRGDAGIKEGRWLKNELMGDELRGKVLGIIGTGRIGLTVARIARAFEMEIIGHDIIIPDEKVLRELGLKMVSLDTLLASSDYVTLHVTLTDDTYHMMGEEELKKMKRTAYLINTSRGAVVDEEALLNALKGGLIRGAALDVFEVEPPTSSELVKLPQVVATPHIGAQTKEAQRLAATLLAEKIAQALMPQAAD